LPNVIAVAHGHQAITLRLTGVQVQEAATAKEAEEICEGHRRGEAKVLIIEERLRNDFSEYFRERLRKHKGLPLVVFCPGFEKEDSDVDAYLSSILRPAVGFEIRLE
jgi:vacuolar-type H+-ATPase subunit F/Vma7